MYYQEFIDRFAAMTIKTLGAALTGIYLHGSVAMKCFNPDKSDIDILIVIESNITDEQKLSFMKNVIGLNEIAPKKGLEMSIVQRKYCKPFVYPTPFELHFSKMHLQWFQENPDDYIKRMNGTDKDLAAHFTIINRYGTALFGEAIPHVFGQVPAKDYMDSIWSDIQNAGEEVAENPIYLILNLCRVLAFVKGGLVLSKLQGGEWGLTHISKKYHPLIREALACYQSNQAVQLDETFAKQFADDLLREIQRGKDEVEANPH